ncbi:hypothetical protein Desca_0598 [Desulfotomaculum nigrificans CO-1-SRB]|uniref:Uncharacterized protein n=1 Tax=Desulfotomaculum nigrificans (strain DSM 14880 / VKM B-2319 / CO-1-SRB) TaxID=868595 RepID=F6B843_DESCC|nr:hypothetical protein [Desulfotomaculum nigrificans]AEF93488.1 hypothetical protein Desca_0598 [Desulfotomaculum nigrificans CO-1-SRB]
MEKGQVRDLVEATAPREDFSGNSFTNVQLDTFRSRYIDTYDEALDLLEDHDITVRRSGKYKWKDR